MLYQHQTLVLCTTASIYRKSEEVSVCVNEMTKKTATIFHDIKSIGFPAPYSLTTANDRESYMRQLSAEHFNLG